jgi:hypothetical protein
MAKTEKSRKGPSDSATEHSVGTLMKGNDGNMWVISTTKTGIHRWTKLNSDSSKPKQTTRKNYVEKKLETEEVSVEKLKQLKKKYKVGVSGSKKEMANGLWRVRRSALSAQDLGLIIKFLPRAEQKKVEKLLNQKKDNPITNYKGMWEPTPKPLTKMSREELIKRLRKLRDAWEKITGRNQDLSNERIDDANDKELRSLLEFYYSDGAKHIAEDWLRE